MKAFKDAHSGRLIRQLTDHRLESKHAYYDVCPWSPDGRLIVFSSADPKDLTAPDGDSVSTRNGQVCTIDTETFEIAVVAEGAFYNSHTGAFPIWNPLKNVVYFRRGPDQIGVLNVDTGERRSMEGVLRQLSPDGSKFASTLNPEDQPRDPDAWGVCTMNEDGSELRRIVPLQRLHELTPNRDQFSIKDMTVGNTKWAPDGQHILVAMWVHPKPRVRRSIYIVSRDGSEARWLTHFGHHHSWTPDGKQVLFNDFKTITADGTCEDPRMFLIAFDGAGRRVVIDQPVGSHPLMDPTGRMIADSDGKGVFVVHVREQRIERVATFRQAFDMSHWGTNPHCVWNRDGTQVLYNSAETGHSEVYVVSVNPTA